MLFDTHIVFPCCLSAVRPGPCTCGLTLTAAYSWYNGLFLPFLLQPEDQDIHLTTSVQMRNIKNAVIVCFWSFSTDLVSLDLFLIKKMTYNPAVQPNHPPLSGVYLSSTFRHHLTVCTVYGETPPPFSSSLYLPVHTVLYSVSKFSPSGPVLFRCSFQSSGAQNTLSIW